MFGKKKKLEEAKQLSNKAIKDITKNDWDHAIQLYHEALAIQEKIVGENHIDTAETYKNLGLVYKFKGDYAEAMSWYQKSLASYESAKDANPRIIAQVRETIATIEKGPQQ
ncbi:MAG: tetratricopeptide repeat protein [Firmicutes bacterium]|nr:tetratricopeptide repeat protein [Bacillota bacterium]